MTDITEKLKYWAFKFCGKGEREDAASDAMTAAVAEIERLHAERDAARAAAVRADIVCDQQHDEIERYREALQKIAGLTMSMCLSMGDLAQRQKDIAFEALGVRHD